MRRRASRRLALAGALVLAAGLVSCFDPRVRETVELLLDAKGGVEVVVRTRLQSESSYSRNPKAAERIVEVREAARCGDDPFTRQLELLSPASLRRSLAYRDGALREVTRAASFDDAKAVERLFEGAPLSVGFLRSGNELTLEILPGKGGRASASELRDVA